METWCRLAWSSLVILLLLQTLNQGRSDFHSLGGRAAFLRSGGKAVRIRIAGPVAQQGVYDFPSGTTQLGAIKLTVPGRSDISPESVAASPVLTGGEVVTVDEIAARNDVITVTSMHARERMLLGVRLEPNNMDMDDWESLPGIGPALAKRIVEYRQNNGGYCSLEDIATVPGIGKKKFLGISKYF